MEEFDSRHGVWALRKKYQSISEEGTRKHMDISGDDKVQWISRPS